jgi:hypothetical protein
MCKRARPCQSPRLTGCIARKSWVSREAENVAARKREGLQRADVTGTWPALPNAWVLGCAFAYVVVPDVGSGFAFAASVSAPGTAACVDVVRDISLLGKLFTYGGIYARCQFAQ